MAATGYWTPIHSPRLESGESVCGRYRRGKDCFKANDGISQSEGELCDRDNTVQPRQSGLDLQSQEPADMRFTSCLSDWIAPNDVSAAFGIGRRWEAISFRMQTCGAGTRGALQTQLKRSVWQTVLSSTTTQEPVLASSWWRTPVPSCGGQRRFQDGSDCESASTGAFERSRWRGGRYACSSVEGFSSTVCIREAEAIFCGRCSIFGMLGIEPL